jgi:hypothetical protein
MTDDLVTWLRTQLDEDEAWALAASRPYEYADEGSKAPEGGVRWQWAVTGEDWVPTTPDPVVNEFVAEPGHSCNLVTVQKWPVTYRFTAGKSFTRMQRRSLANDIVEMDSAAAGHIVRHDPARVLAEVEAKRRIIDLAEVATQREATSAGYDAVARLEKALAKVTAPELERVLRLLALPYADREGYQEEWAP